MNIRAICNRDIDQLVEIWKTHFSDEFSLEDFFSGLKFSCLAEEDGKIISAAGIRPINEIVMLTDKSASNFVRGKAFLELLGCMRKFNPEQLHAFIQDEVWKKHLLKHGFRLTKGQALVIG